MTNTQTDTAYAIGTVAHALPAIDPETPCARAYALMMELSAEAGLAVVRDGRPIGLAGRRRLLHNLAHPVTYALYETRPISLIMDDAPLIVKASTCVDRVTERIATEKVSALDDGFIVVADGQYLGVGTITALLNLSVKKARGQIAALEAARAEAERASASKSSFLANVSHELRTPLNAILGFSELVANGTAGPVTEQQTEYLGDIQTSGRRLLALINDLLDLSRAESGRLELREDTIDLDSLVHEAQRTLLPRAREKGLVVNVEHTARVDLVCDEQKLLQVLLNLLNNAVKFTPAGGRVDLVTDRSADGGVRVHVVDTGQGIPEGDRDRVLEPFGRGRDQAVRQAEGAGVGLALTRVLVGLHGGDLELASEVAVGTRFTIDLPAERIRADADGDTRPGAMTAGGGAR